MDRAGCSTWLRLLLLDRCEESTLNSSRKYPGEWQSKFGTKLNKCKSFTRFGYHSDCFLIRPSRGESFHAWRTFAAAYPEHFNEAKYRYLVDIKLPGLPLADYFKGLDSTDINWLTGVRLPPRQMSVADVIRVASIKNLAVLDLSDGHVNEASSPALDERVFKSWIELAATEGAFRHLRVLMLGWQEVLSKWIFKHLDSFPSLCCLLVTDSLKMHQKNRSYWEEEAAKYGWVARSAKKSAKSLKPILEDKNFHLGAVSGCYYDAQELFAQLASEKKPSIAARLPVLECWLGGPKRWIHVVEEFPGTRTVWFDNVKINSCGTNYEGGAETETDRDHFKRDREVDSPTKGLLPPPSKRSIAKRRQKGRSAADLLAEFGHVYPGNQTM